MHFPVSLIRRVPCRPSVQATAASSSAAPPPPPQAEHDVRRRLRGKTHDAARPAVQLAGAAQPGGSRPPCAGVGDPNRFTWACWDCLADLAAPKPKMPIYACANDNWKASPLPPAPSPKMCNV